MAQVINIFPNEKKSVLRKLFKKIKCAMAYFHEVTSGACKDKVVPVLN
jgi:hypothetical protein